MERETGFLRSGVFRRCAGKIGEGNGEFPAQRQQIFHVGHGCVGLPFAYRLTADPKALSQCLLTETQRLSVRCDAFSKRHDRTSFPKRCFSENIIAEMGGRGYHPGVKYRLRRGKTKKSSVTPYAKPEKYDKIDPAI